MTPPILMPTTPWYEPLARWTVGQIKLFWPEHPAIFFCGASGGENCLAKGVDPRNWMRLTLAACGELRSHGHHQCFVILDDHPPIAPCHTDYLLKALPLAAAELQATSITTGGFGPTVPRIGSLEQWRSWRFERLPMSAAWKLPLHPALWNLERLQGILEALLENLPEDKQTAWNFERVGSNAENGIVRHDWLGSCYRGDARQTTTKDARQWQEAGDRLKRMWRTVHAALSRRLGRHAGPDCFKQVRFGAYPCFWSGVMKKGKLNQNYCDYARTTGRSELTDGLAEAFAACRTS